MSASKLKICYVLAYYFPQYVRTQVLVAGLEGLAETAVYPAINERTDLWRYLQTIWRLVNIRLRHHPDIYLLGFRGTEYFWLIRLLTWPKPLVYDHMMSPYDSLLYEKKTVRPGSLLARLIWRYERAVLRAATLVLTDTVLHSRFLADTFDLPIDQFFDVPVGATEALFYPRNGRLPSPPLRIFFYGSFLPLHGVEIILEAAAQVADLPLVFELVGGHQRDLSWFFAKIAALGLTNVHHTDWVPYAQLPERIAAADVCIGGPLGNTGQSSRIITGKTFQFLAMAKPTIIGDVAMAHPFVDRENCLLIPQGNALALAEALRWAVNQPACLPAMGQSGRQVYEAHFSQKQVENRLAIMLEKARR